MYNKSINSSGGMGGKHKGTKDRGEVDARNVWLDIVYYMYRGWLIKLKSISQY